VVSDAKTGAELAALHVPRLLPELAETIERTLRAAGVDGDVALFQAGRMPASWVVEVARASSGLPPVGAALEVRSGLLLRACGEGGAVYETPARPAEPHVPVAAFPLRYGGAVVGHLALFGGPGVAEDLRERCETLADHVAVAFTNIQLLADSVEVGDQYLGNLLAYRELDQLLLATDVDQVASRLLAALLRTLATHHGALLLKDADGKLVVRAGWGIPDAVLEGLTDGDGRWWPATLCTGPARVLRRDAGGRFAGLRGGVPDGVASLVGMALASERGMVGVVVAVNAPAGGPGFRRDLETCQGLCDLGAAVLDNRLLHDQALAARRYEEELRIAQAIQVRLRPRDVPTVSGVDSAFRTAPAEFVAGDYVELLFAEDGAVHAAIADVSGHGIGAALLMSSVRAEFRSSARRESMAATMARLNETVRDEVGESGMFVTAFHARIAPDQRRVDYVNAGHNHGILWQAAARRIERLPADSPPLGFAIQAEQTVRSLPLAEGDLLVIYSDGIVDATHPRTDEPFGEERLEASIARLAGGSAAEITDGIFGAVQSFTGRTATEDDVSVIVLRIPR
jgi:serine phosphatase RsbU (regulator of sigma subunit)